MGRLPKKKSTKTNSSSGSTSSGGSSGSKKKDSEGHVADPPGDVAMMEDPTPPSTADVFRQISSSNGSEFVDVDVETQNNAVANESPATNEIAATSSSGGSAGKSAAEKTIMVKRVAVTILLCFCLGGIGTVVGLLAKAKPFTKELGDGTTQQPLQPGGDSTPPNYGGDGGSDGDTTQATPGAGGDNNGSGGNKQVSPTPAPTAGTMIRIMDYVKDEIGIDIDETNIGPDGEDANEPLKKAAMWLSHDTDEPVFDSKFIQRFAVLAVDFALQGRNRTTNDQMFSFNNPVNRAGDGAEFVTDPIFALHDVDECMWEGVVCSDNGTIVTELHYGRLGLSGTIPSSISLLKNVTHIDFNTNKIYGTIPDTLYDLTNLNSLYLYKNQLRGSIPYALSKLSNLQNLWLNENAMTGPFPIGISSTEGYIHPIRKYRIPRRGQTYSQTWTLQISFASSFSLAP